MIFTGYIGPEQVAQEKEKLSEEFLNSTEKQQYERILAEAGMRVACDWLAGRAALKTAAANIFASDYKQLEISNDERGVPYLPAYSSFCCSISHAEGAGFGAISLKPVGIDLEFIKNRNRSMLDYISHSEEQRLISKYSNDKDELITKIWVIKESVLKAMKTGLALPPKALKIEAFDDDFIVQAQNTNENISRWKVACLQDKNKLASLARPYED